ncbi:MAG: PqqD family peptide modification chaperone [Aquabacterium sp.]|uniref:PqqD family peptide modification chaperone n=1 Tax=Aquabacterium sp. TaxID=1872578 RepID=UPI003BD6B028
MTSALFSSSWYRVTDLKPRLRNQARLVRHTYRGQRWHVMQDLASGRVMRFNPAAYQVLALMDGVRTLDDIWRQACLILGDQAPTQDEVLSLLAQLHQANVLLTDKQPDLDEITERGDRLRKAKLMQYLANPLSVKLPLFDPEPMMSALMRWVPGGLWPWLLALWGMIILGGIGMAALHWTELTHDLTSRVFTSDNLLIMALVYPLVKGFHEFGHALAIKAVGGRCREVGLMFLVFIPVPYVDATQSVMLPNKWHRFLIGGAGMLAELGLGAIALWLWTQASGGITQAVLHQVVILAGVTTVVFNANPLLRFDGYYMLSDALEIPNLAQRANLYVSYLAKKYLFRVEARPPLHLTPREPAWLTFYAFGSVIYRTMVTLSIIVLIAGKFFVFGVLLAMWSGYGLLIKPLVNYVKFVQTDASLEGGRQRVVIVTAAAVMAVAAFIGFVPVANWTMAEGIIWMPEESRVRVPSTCFGAKVLAKPGQFVQAGQPLLSCAEPTIEAQVEQVQASVREQEARLALAETTERVNLQIARAELTYQLQRLADLEQRRNNLVLRSSHAGRFDMDAPADFAGSYYDRGAVVAYVLDPSRYTLLTVVPQDRVDLVRQRTESVEIRSVESLWHALQARIVREVPAASAELPSMALALQGGGKIGLNPDASSRQETPQALEPLFQFEMQFSGDVAPSYLGGRVYVRFAHKPEPLGSQWYRSLRQQFMKHFSV